jgi:hypothetical protein
VAAIALSAELTDALATFRSFLVSDDVDRGEVIEASTAGTLTALVAAVTPLYPEIDATLDKLVALPHPLPEDDEQLEEDLNSLAQAALEAEQELDGRSD